MLINEHFCTTAKILQKEPDLEESPEHEISVRRGNTV